MNNNNSNKFHMSIGTSLILVTLVLLSLVSFASLSYICADNDYKLSKKAADATREMYNNEYDIILEKQYSIIEKNIENGIIK